MTSFITSDPFIFSVFFVALVAVIGMVRGSRYGIPAAMVATIQVWAVFFSAVSLGLIN